MSIMSAAPAVARRGTRRAVTDALRPNSWRAVTLRLLVQLQRSYSAVMVRLWCGYSVVTKAHNVRLHTRYA